MVLFGVTDQALDLLRDLLAGVGEPYLMVRLGHVESREPLPPSPRRDAAEVITVED